MPFHRALADEVALSAEGGIVDDGIRLPAVGMAGVVDLLGRIGAGVVCCDGHGLHAVLLLHLLGLGIELLLAAPHEDEVTTLAGMDVLEAGAEPAVGTGDEGCVAERCVLHDVGSFPCAALPSRFFLTVKRLRGRGSSQNISVCQPAIRLRHSVPRNLSCRAGRALLSISSLNWIATIYLLSKLLFNFHCIGGGFSEQVQRL